MAQEIKTKPTRASVPAYLKAIADPERRADCMALAALMKKLTGKNAVLWGEHLIGFDSMMQKYANGSEVAWLKLGFASRKAAISIYISCNLDPFTDLLEKLGPHKRGVGCLYVKRLKDIDMRVLEKMMRRAID